MSRDFNSEYENKEMLGNNYEPEADEEANPYLEDKDADRYDVWREGCSEEFDVDLSELIKKYLAKKQHYMNNKSHIVESLKSRAFFIEKYELKRGVKL